MKIMLEPGRYIVAVSGGVDSVVLLHLLQGRPELRLTVAHFDHGIRSDSHMDRLFVRDLAKRYGLPFASNRGHLGAQTSEAAARQARYKFLDDLRRAAQAKAIVTAHHRDDVLETAILNIIRGTGRRGLSSLQSTDTINRPMLHVPKVDITRYARDNQLLWHEDSTNASDNYRRNYVRHHLLSRFSPRQREQLHDSILSMRRSNAELDELLAEIVAQYSHPMHPTRLKRQEFIMLPHAVAREVMAAWLRANGITTYDKKMLEKLVQAAKTYTVHKQVSIIGGCSMIATKNFLVLTGKESSIIS